MKTADEQENHHRTRDGSFPSRTKEPATKPLIPSSRRVTDDREAKRNNDMDLLTITPRWALCPLGWQAHAVDAWADHPLGVWIARCGHRLSGGTPLYDLPQCQQCPSCARWSPVIEAGAGQ